MKDQDYRIAIRPDDKGVDDVVVKDVECFRLERMDDDWFWLCCYLKGVEGRFVLYLSAHEGKILCKIGEELPEVPMEEGSMKYEEE